MNKKNTISDLKKLNEEMTNLKKSLFNLYFQKSSGQLENTSKIKIIKKDIARIKSKISNNIGVKNA